MLINICIIISIIFTPFLFNNKKVQSATYTWNQDDWSEGLDINAEANHTNQIQNNNEWKKYYSSSNVVVGTTPNQVSLETTNTLEFTKKYDFEKDGHIYSDTAWNIENENIQLTQQGKVKSYGYYESPVIQGFNDTIDWNNMNWDEKLNKKASFKGFIDSNRQGINSIIPYDLDDDGNVDFVVATEDPGSMVGWYKNNGDEEFELIPIDSITLNPSGYLRGGYRIKIIDFDNDGYVDIVVSGFASGIIRLYKNDGSENFQRINLVSSVAYVKGFDIADFNNDGFYDIVLASEGENAFMIFTNNGDNTFSNDFPGKRYVDMGISGANDVAIAKINNDDHFDIIGSGYYQDQIIYYENNGFNYFSKQVIDNTIDGPYTIQLFDLDQNGEKDILLAAELSDQIIVYYNSGGVSPIFTKDILASSLDGIRSFFIKDLDNDSDYDIAVLSYNSGEVAYLENTGSSFTKKVITTKFKNGTFIYAHDIDNDGDTDLVGSTNNGSAVWWENDFGTFKNVFNKVNLTIDPFSGASDAFAVDIDGDTDIDIVACGASANEVAWWENDGDENFTKLSISSDVENPQTVFSADIDGVNGPDIISADFNGNRIIWWENDGKGNFTLPGSENIITTTYAGPNDVYVDDVNGDGHNDILSVATNGGTVDWWENDGNTPPSFTRRNIDNTVSRTFNLASSVIGVDIDGDTDLDIVASAKSDNKIVLWINNGANPPIFTATTIDNDFYGAYDVDAEDIDGDGLVDIIGVATEGNKLAWWKNLGSNTFSTVTIIDSSLDKAFSVDAADIDEDGDGDIVAVSPTDGAIYWWENTGDGVFEKKLIKEDSIGASSVFIYDIDKDSNLDILSSVRDTSSIEWYKNKQSFSDIKIQVRSGNNPLNLGNYKGPSGLEGDCRLTDISLPYCFTNPISSDISFLPNSQYFQFIVFFTTTGSRLTSELISLSIEATNAVGYKLSGEIVTSPYDSEDGSNAIADLFWDEGAGNPTNTSIKAQIRTAADDGDGNPDTWTNWKGPTDEYDYYEDNTGNLILDEFSDSGEDTPEDQWFQVKFILESNVFTTPTLTGTHVKYVINDPPVITLLSTPSLNSNGVITIPYEITDVDVTGDPLTDDLTSDVYFFVDIGIRLGTALNKTENSRIITNSINTNFLEESGTIMIDKEIIEYSNITNTNPFEINTLLRGGPSVGYKTTITSHDSGSIVWVKAESSSGNIGRVNNDPQEPNKVISWTLNDDFTDFYKADSRLRVVGIDKNAAKQIGFVDITPVVLDSRAPAYNLVNINSRLDEINFDISDDSQIQMRISNVLSTDPVPIPIADGTNPDSGNWISYVTQKNWIFEDFDNDGVEKIYVQFRDVYGNYTGVYTISTPQTPEDILIQDASNPDSNDWRLFVSWSVIPQPTIDFKGYNLYRSEDIDNFATTAVKITEINEILQNYFVDEGLDNTKTYYYRVSATDIEDNESNFSQLGTGINQKQYSSDLGLQPDGSGGGNFNPPIISNVSVNNITSSTATITWDTDLLSDSLVSYSKDYSYNNFAVYPTVVTEHQVVLSNLDENSTYYFKIRSRTPIGEQSEEENPSVLRFTTTADNDPPVISNVIELTSTSSTVITWSTDEPATSQILYGLTDQYGLSLPEDSNLVLGHSMQIPDLDSNTDYFYKIISKDTNGNLSEYEDQFKTAVDNSDTTPPVISNVVVSNITTASSTINWNTDEDAISWVEYGETVSLGRGEITDTDVYKQNFEIDLSNLEEEVTYSYAVISIDRSGNRSSTVVENFSTIADNPVISDISVFTTTNSAAIVWSTSEPATGKVDYGFTSAYGQSTPVDSNLKYSHLIEITNLEINRSYHYMITSSDENGNTSTTQDLTFTTTNSNSDTIPAIISDITVSNIQATNVQISWNTSEDTISWVSYGTNSNYSSGSINNSNDFNNSYSASLSGLSSDTLYYYKIFSIDPSGNRSASEEMSLRTEVGSDGDGGFNNSPVKIENGTSISEITINSVKVSWKTDIEATTSVLYKEKGSNEAPLEAKLNSNLTTNHEITITNLEPDTVYEYQAVSKSNANNTIVSEISEFKTLVKLTISDVIVSNRSLQEVVIYWASNIDMTSEIRYGSVSGRYAFSTTPSNTYSRLHTVNIANLSGGNRYYFQVIGRDRYGNLTISDEYSFVTKQSPSISGVQIEQVNPNTVRVSYATSINTITRIRYQDTNVKELQTAEKLDRTTNHLMELTKLMPGAKYELTIFTLDDDNDESSSDLYSFTTLKDIEGPIISSVQTKATILDGKNTKVQAIFSWVTDEESTSEISFLDKEVSIPESVKKLGEDYTLNHTIVISTLSPTTVYKYKLTSKDIDGNITESDTYALLTPATRVSIIDLIIKNLEDVFGWTSNI